MHRQDIDTNPANYEPNSINDNWPLLNVVDQRLPDAFTHVLRGDKQRADNRLARCETFFYRPLNDENE
jgi:hypothetical protein